MLTDFIIITCLTFFFGAGWYKGFLRTVSGPLSFLIGCLLGFIYYQKTQKFLESLLITILAPFVVYIILSIFLRLFKKSTGEKEPPLSLGRLLGGMLNLGWSGSLLILTLIFMTALPINLPPFSKIQEEIKDSRSYALLSKYLGKRFSATTDDLKNITSVLGDYSTMEKMSSTPEFQKLQSHPKIIEIHKDPQTTEQIKNRDYFQLLKNPKIIELLNDREMVKSLIEFNERILRESLNAEQKTKKKTSAQPKIIEIKAKEKSSFPDAKLRENAVQ